MDEVIKWIDVETEMPDDSVEVMTCHQGPENENRVWIGYWDSESFAWRAVDGWPLPNVTHWAEVPEGPKVTA